MDNSFSEKRAGVPVALVALVIAGCVAVLACYWLSLISFQATALTTLVVIFVCRNLAHRSVSPELRQLGSWKLITAMYAGALYFSAGAVAWVVRPATDSGGRIFIPLAYLAIAAFACTVGNRLAKRAGQS